MNFGKTIMQAKNLLLGACCLICLEAQADQTPGIICMRADGEETGFALTTVSKITFEQTNGRTTMSVALNDDTEAVGGFSVIRFGDVEVPTPEPEDPTASRDLETARIRIYPNPVINDISIDGTTGGAKLEIRDLSGRLRLSQCEKTANVSFLEPGTYVVSVGSTSARFIKK